MSCQLCDQIMHVGPCPHGASDNAHTGQPIYVPPDHGTNITDELRGIRIALENVAAELLSARRYK